MARVDAGSYILEIHTILSMPNPASILDWALTEASLVTSPALVYVERPRLRLAVGPGSLVSESEPPLPAYRLASPQWIDTCIPTGEPRYRVLGGRVELEATVEAREVKDLAALLVNGVRGRHILSGEEGEAYAVAGGYKVLDWAPGEGYLLHASSGEAYRRLSYIAPLASTCTRR